MQRRLQQMEYVIECRFSDAFTSSPPVQDLMPNAREIVLFSYAFSFVGTIDGAIGPEPASQVVTTALEELRPVFDPPLDFTLSDVAAEEGSVIITLLLASVVAPAASSIAVPAGAIAGAGGIALWAADRFLGGALSKAGERLAQNVFARLAGPALIATGLANGDAVRDPQLVADQQASEIALPRGCNWDRLAGGTHVSSGGKVTGYQYAYRLVPTIPGARPAMLKVIVDRYARHPVEYHVFEVLEEPAVSAPAQSVAVHAPGSTVSKRRGGA